MPPAPRNPPAPTTEDTPASPPATSLRSPRAIAAQKRCRCSRRPTGGRPGERITGRPVCCAPHPFGLPLATLHHRALRRPLESALAAPVAVMDQSDIGAAPPERHLKRFDDQFGAHVVGHRPAD